MDAGYSLLFPRPRVPFAPHREGRSTSHNLHNPHALPRKPRPGAPVSTGVGHGRRAEAQPKGSATMTQSVETNAQGLPQLRGDFPLPLRSLLDSGVHFGHQTKRWNPQMRPYIYGARNSIHIIDLDQTARLFARAYQFVVDTVGRG